MNKMGEMSSDEEVIKRNMGYLKLGMEIDTDQALLRRSDTSSLSEHNTQYTELLKAYVNDFKENSSLKRKNKQIMFWIALILLIGITVAIIWFMYETLSCLVNDKIDVLETLPGLITAIGTLLGTFKMIPQLITEYLFNKEEEKHLTDIISKIQEYDRDIRGEL